MLTFLLYFWDVPYPSDFPHYLSSKRVLSFYSSLNNNNNNNNFLIFLSSSLNSIFFDLHTRIPLYHHKFHQRLVYYQLATCQKHRCPSSSHDPLSQPTSIIAPLSWADLVRISVLVHLWLTSPSISSTTEYSQPDLDAFSHLSYHRHVNSYLQSSRRKLLFSIKLTIVTRQDIPHYPSTMAPDNNNKYFNITKEEYVIDHFP